MTQPAAIPDNEAARLARLRMLDILDSEPEVMFDTLTRLAAEIAEVPIALVSMVDEERQWFKASFGLQDIRETPRDVAFCSHAILGSGIMEVADATLDIRFADNPLVTGDLGIRFYAGAPITLSDGVRLGTLCVIDKEPRKLSNSQRATLVKLAEVIGHAIEAREDAANVLRLQHKLQDQLAFVIRRVHLLGATIEACPIAISVTDMTMSETPVIYANPTYLQLTGYHADEIVGQACHHLTGRTISPQVAEELRRTVASGRQTEIEVITKRKDNQKFLSRLTVAPIQDENGRVTACVSLQSDITFQAQTRDAIEHQREKMAAIGRSMGGVAHEVNNMLQPVVLLAQDVLDQELVSPDGRGHMEIVLDCVESARRIIGDILAFSRPTTPPEDLQDLAALLSNSIVLAKVAVPPTVSLVVSIEDRQLRVAVEPTKFVQILLNLIGNAVAAMDRRGRLTIALDEHWSCPADHSSDPQIRYARLRVMDTGCGMDALTLDRAFEPFFTTKPIGQGTGLGLPMVYSLVREMSGMIELASQPGQGTTVTILLTAADGTS